MSVVRSLVPCASLVLALGPLSAAGAQASAARRAFAPGDWYRLTTLSAPALSPDGQSVAFTVQTALEKDNKYHREVWVVPTAGGDPVRFTSPGTESSAPRFSPDGRYLIFTSSRPGGKGASWVLRMDRPGGEAYQPADDPLQPGSVPASKKFQVWVSPAPADSGADSARGADPFTRMGATARPPYGAITRPVDPARFDGRHIVDLAYKANGPGFLPNRTRAPSYRASQIWMATLDGPVRKRQLTNTAYSHREAVVSPDGNWVAFVADARLRSDSAVQAERDSLARLPYDAARDEAERNESDIFVMPISGGEPRRVVEAMGQERDLAWSPDGRFISYIASPGRVASRRLYVVPVRGGAPTNLVGSFPYEPQEYQWVADDAIAMVAEVGGRTAIYTVNPRTRAMREVIGGRRQIRGIAVDSARRRVAFVATDVTHPTELFVANLDGTGERQLTHFNDKLNGEIAWSDAERFTYPSVGGLQIEGWLMKPYGYEPGKRYPLVLYIHGGPHSSYTEGWFDEFQNLAGAGMWVLYTNPRGSSGYGADFTYATRGRWGAEDYEDLMKAVDIAARRPEVDSTRMGVAGGSYGGFMTAWITTRTSRFRAAEADRMISEWTFWYGASDAQGLTEFEFYGKPWDNFAMYDTLSPIRRVNRVRTPTLIVQSEEDFRTPMGNAELWFMALRKQGVPVEFIRYPRSTHDLSRTGEPWLLVDRLGRIRQWFAYWLQGQRPAAPRAADVGR